MGRGAHTSHAVTVIDATSRVVDRWTTAAGRSAGPSARRGRCTSCPKMSEPDWTPRWRPGLADYLYLLLTNAASFAPPETMPLTKTAQLLMGTQTLASLVMTAIVLAYAVNNLS
jgi:hypothetical protein